MEKMNQLAVHHFFDTPLVVRFQPPTGRVIVTARYQGFTVEAEGNHMAYVLPDAKQIKVAIAYQDADGNDAQIDGAVHWESSDSTVIEVFADDDEGEGSKRATVQAVSLGTAQVVARADADLGDGARELITTFDVEVVAGEAVAGVISPAGEPEDIP